MGAVAITDALHRVFAGSDIEATCPSSWLRLVNMGFYKPSASADSR